MVEFFAYLLILLSHFPQRNEESQWKTLRKYTNKKRRFDMYTNKRGCLMEFKMRNHTTSPYKDDGQQQRILGGGIKLRVWNQHLLLKQLQFPKYVFTLPQASLNSGQAHLFHDKWEEVKIKGVQHSLGGKVWELKFNNYLTDIHVNYVMLYKIWG